MTIAFDRVFFAIRIVLFDGTFVRFVGLGFLFDIFFFSMSGEFTLAEVDVLFVFSDEVSTTTSPHFSIPATNVLFVPPTPSSMPTEDVSSSPLPSSIPAECVSFSHHPYFMPADYVSFTNHPYYMPAEDVSFTRQTFPVPAEDVSFISF